MNHPFAEHLGLTIVRREAGLSTCTLDVRPEHLNPHGVVHGAVLFALADTGMGAALYPTLQADESCATIEIKINFLKAVRTGRIDCSTTMLGRGRRVANLESRLLVDGELVASANGNFAIFPRPGAAR